MESPEVVPPRNLLYAMVKAPSYCQFLGEPPTAALGSRSLWLLNIPSPRVGNNWYCLAQGIRGEGNPLSPVVSNPLWSKQSNNYLDQRGEIVPIFVGFWSHIFEYWSQQAQALHTCFLCIFLKNIGVSSFWVALVVKKEAPLCLLSRHINLHPLSPIIKVSYSHSRAR